MNPENTRAEPAAADAALDWTRRLVAIDTTSRNSNLGLIELVRDTLERAHVQTHLSHDAGGAKANLFATIAAADGATQGGIVLSGHTDVVPVDGQAWDSDPFRPEIRAGRLYGRGTCDMKGFIGSAMALLPRVLDTPLRKPLHLAFSYDEEMGCLGAPVMLADLRRRGIRPDGCIVGEPTSMQVIVAHKGINAWRCVVHGRAAHSSLTPRGVNAIEYAARLVTFIRDLADRMKQGPFEQDFDVPFSTAQVGTIAGGIAVNTVPDHCEFQFEYRNLPGTDPALFHAAIERHVRQTLLPQMHAEHSDAAIELSPLAVAPAMSASEQAAVTRLVRALTGDQARRKVAYGTEAGQFQAAGIPTVICGPGDIQQAHKANEYIALEQLGRCTQFLSRVIDSLNNHTTET